MDVLHIPYALENYVYMGCWNKTGCAQKGSGQDQVAKAIRKEPIGWPLFLGGDNIYPDKIAGKKTYKAQRVLDGLKCLQGSRMRPIFGTVGNHNIAKADVLTTELQAPAWTVKADPYCLLFSNKRAMIFLNSNSLANEAHGEADEVEGMLDMLDRVVVDLVKAGISYTLIMHHPLISLKKAGYYVLPGGARLLDRLVGYPVLPTMILVADTHNYQRGIIEWRGVRIRQVVVGTGGADLDPITVSPRRLGEGGPVGFGGRYIVEESAVAFGYLRVLGSVAEFVEVRPTPTRLPRSPKSHTGSRTARASVSSC